MRVPHGMVLLAYVALFVGWYWLTARRERATAMFARLYATHLLGWRKGDRGLPANGAP